MVLVFIMLVYVEPREQTHEAVLHGEYSGIHGLPEEAASTVKAGVLVKRWFSILEAALYPRSPGNKRFPSRLAFS